MQQQQQQQQNQPYHNNQLIIDNPISLPSCIQSKETKTFGSAKACSKSKNSDSNSMHCMVQSKPPIKFPFTLLLPQLSAFHVWSSNPTARGEAPLRNQPSDNWRGPS